MKTSRRSASRPFTHPLHAIFIAAGAPLYLGASLSDWRYGLTFDIQWHNFAAWLVSGGLLFTGLALLWSTIRWFRSRRGGFTLLLLAAIFGIGFLNVLMHAKDGWAMMPEGLILSIASFILALAAAWLSFAAPRHGAAR